MFEGAGCADAPGFCRCARSIENFCRIKMVVARASGTLMASSLSQNTFLTLGVRPAGPHRPTTLKIKYCFIFEKNKAATLFFKK